MFFAIDAAHNLGEQGSDATVRLIDAAGLPVAVWTHGSDSYPPVLAGGGALGVRLGNTRVIVRRNQNGHGVFRGAFARIF